MMAEPSFAAVLTRFFTQRLMQQRHAKPAMRQCAMADHLAFALQLRDPLAVDE